MNVRAALIGMALWLSLLGLGGKWTTNPILKPPAPNLAAITPEQTAKAFLIHFTPLAPKPSTAGGNALPPNLPAEAMGGVLPHKFDYEEWAFHESRRRGLTFLSLWIAAGLGILWFTARRSRKPSGVR